MRGRRCQLRRSAAAPVDLLWNGGIGTYIKATAESNADIGDKANDPIRLNGSQVNVRVIGEGGNLGLSQLGRIEYAQVGADGTGGRINTDAIDNSAGVDTSDHEVNIKIVLDRIVHAGALADKDRSRLLTQMTDEVARLVLRDNIEQNVALSVAQAQAPAMLPVHRRLMAHLERQGDLDRALEFARRRRTGPTRRIGTRADLSRAVRAAGVREDHQYSAAAPK